MHEWMKEKVNDEWMNDDTQAKKHVASCCQTHERKSIKERKGIFSLSIHFTVGYKMYKATRPEQNGILAF